MFIPRSNPKIVKNVTKRKRQSPLTSRRRLRRSVRKRNAAKLRNRSTYKAEGKKDFPHSQNTRAPEATNEPLPVAHQNRMGHKVPAPKKRRRRRNRTPRAVKEDLSEPNSECSEIAFDSSKSEHDSLDSEVKLKSPSPARDSVPAIEIPSSGVESEDLLDYRETSEEPLLSWELSIQEANFSAATTVCV